MADDDQTNPVSESVAVLPADWKKQGFDLNERLTLKHNTFEAERYRERQNQKKQKTHLKSEKKQLPLHKIPSKIKDIYDDENDEDEYGIYQPIRVRAEENPLYNALDENEKRLYMQKDTIKQTQMQQTAGKMEALQVANTLAKEVGLSHISPQNANAKLNEAVFDPKKMQEKVIDQEVGGKLGLKGKIEDGKIVEAAKGIKKIQAMSDAKGVQNMQMDDVVRIGEDKLSDKEIAELILEKSGQDAKKAKLKKPSQKEVKTEHFEKNKQKSKALQLLKQKKDDLSR